MSKKLLLLAQSNRDAAQTIRADASEDGDCTDVYIYGSIDDDWGISAQQFIRTIAAISTPNIRLRINSPGGDVCEARAMMAAMVDHAATFTARIDGLCASAATALTLPCESVEIVDGGFFMIHNAWTVVMGNAADMRHMASVLDKADASIVQGYAARSGLGEDEVRAMMAAETWLSAQEAVDQNFCDSVMLIPTGGKGAQAKAKMAFNLSAYANVPKALTEPDAATTAADDELLRKQALDRLSLFERQL